MYLFYTFLIRKTGWGVAPQQVSDVQFLLTSEKSSKGRLFFHLELCGASTNHAM